MSSTVAETRIEAVGASRFSSRRADRRIASLAAGQLGIVARAQLLELGLGASAIASRVSRGRLVTVHRGAYALGLPLVDGAHELAAALACGPTAAVSHRSAARIWGIGSHAGQAIDLTVGATGRARPGVRFHSRHLIASDRAIVRGIPVTAVPRTLLDLATVLSPDRLARAINRAEQLRLFDLGEVTELIDRSRGRRGVAKLRHALGLDVAPTANALEDAMLAICRRAGIPAPEVNVWVPLPSGDGLRPDFLWRDLGIAVEADGFEAHGTRRAFGADRARDRRLRTQTGIETLRFTWHEVMREPTAVERELRDILCTAASPGSRDEKQRAP